MSNGPRGVDRLLADRNSEATSWHPRVPDESFATWVGMPPACAHVGLHVYKLKGQREMTGTLAKRPARPAAISIACSRLTCSFFGYFHQKFRKLATYSWRSRQARVTFIEAWAPATPRDGSQAQPPTPTSHPPAIPRYPSYARPAEPPPSTPAAYSRPTRASCTSDSSQLLRAALSLPQLSPATDAAPATISAPASPKKD